MPVTDIFEVDPWLAQHDDFPRYELSHGCRASYAAGLQFGSRFVGGLFPGLTVEYLPTEQLKGLSNLQEFAGILCLDNWTCNSDGRQAVFSRPATDRRYRATFIDQGSCFQDQTWDFKGAPMRGLVRYHQRYTSVIGWASFEPWLSRIKEFEPGILWNISQIVPPEWYDHDETAIAQLVDRLIGRRARVRELSWSFASPIAHHSQLAIGITV